jgi:hypothetical protein
MIGGWLVAPDDVLCETSFIMEGTIDASSIVVVSGHASAGKVVAVDGMDDEAIRAAWPLLPSQHVVPTVSAVE